MSEKEVITCKECSKWPYEKQKYADNTIIRYYAWCERMGPKDYCSKAERKDNAGG